MKTKGLEIEVHDSSPVGWEKFVSGHPQSRIYHLDQWNQIIEQSFGHSTKYIVLKEEGNIAGILPLTEFKSFFFGRFAVSLPFVDYGGSLVNNDRLNHPLLEFLGEVRREKKFDFIELRFDAPISTSLPSKQHKVSFNLQLQPDAEELFNSFKAKLRSQIRRPTKENMYAKRSGVEGLDDFYMVFALNMRDLGTPVYPKRFFRNILETFPKNAFIVTIYSQDQQPAAASLLLKYREIMEIPWASSLRRFNRFSPNMLLYWESIKLAIEENCRVFDMGRCNAGSGTYRFKKQWGVPEKQLYWYYLLPDSRDIPAINPENPKYQLMIKTWQKLPLFLTRTIGPLITRNLP